MSVCRHIKLKCPDCGGRLDAVLWDSVNAQLDPEIKEALLQGNLHRFECPQCREVKRLDRAFLYHDMEKQFMVWYYPFESLKEPDFFNPFSVDGTLDTIGEPQVADTTNYFKNTHYVFSLNELVRYILFREKLPDAKDIIIKGEYAE
jgi:hypothetical protein